MLIETVKKLMNSNLSAYEIGKKTGVDPASIRRIRRGERTVGKLGFDTVENSIIIKNNQQYPHLNLSIS
ncbi:XRE family transcriptional regulator [Staphylococcus schweitzeri]|uniref:XRE family transcriptional regulator n=1 Tax=Staphylococcus schweitzeri TaxID=1654388 RepID=UPI000AD85CDD|nr:XRE family transcriptional regulator [Staphylococcus schweitzeri]